MGQQPSARPATVEPPIGPMLGAPETLEETALARFGAKAASLSRLIAGGLSTPEGVAIEAEACARQRRRLADGETLDPAFLGAARAAVARLGDAVMLRLSPSDPVPGLVGGAPFDPIELEARLISALTLWDARKTVRRRAAAGASAHCALILQSAAREHVKLTGLRLHDPENGEAAAAARIEGGAPPSGLVGVSTPPDEALALAERAEAILEAPLELDLAMDPRLSEPLVLAARPLRLSARGRLRAAVRLAEMGRLSRDAALLTVEPDLLEELLHATIDPKFARDRLATGIPASPGAAAGLLCLTTEEAQECKRAGEPAILARFETSPEDVHGMDAAAGVLTLRGGLTSHAAVVARGLGLPCVVGATDARIDLEEGVLISADGRRFERGVWITLDGSTGDVIAGRAPTRQVAPTGDFATLMGWADRRRRLRVRANADTPAELATAVRLGVDGVGLCRTEHMFFEPGRVNAMREMILADGEPERRAALEKLLPMQRADFQEIFEIMEGARAGEADAAPVTIRLLDPPLHEFLPQDEEGVHAMAAALGRTPDEVVKRARDLREFNPMLGKRGCRLGVAYPEIYETQARAIFEAALDAEQKTGRAPNPEIMVPLVSAVSELQLIKARIAAVAEAVANERGAKPHYGLGIMVETPRAALLGGPLAPLSSFFSFGTNDLTQMTYGLSRDDAGGLMRDYVEREVFEADPFQTLDRDGVGELIRIAVARGKGANPEIEIGMCGEHGGSPCAIAFCEETGFDYVSCSPYRAPIARLAAAQAAIRVDRKAAQAQSGRPADPDRAEWERTG